MSPWLLLLLIPPIVGFVIAYFVLNKKNNPYGLNLPPGMPEHYLHLDWHAPAGTVIWDNEKRARRIVVVESGQRYCSQIQTDGENWSESASLSDKQQVISYISMNID